MIPNLQAGRVSLERDNFYVLRMLHSFGDQYIDQWKAGFLDL